MKFWKIKNIAKNRGEIQLYGDISESSWWGDEVTPKEFADDLRNLGDVSDIDVRINSMGGDVFAANTISSLLRAHSANVDIYIDGMAASAATIVAMAGNKVYMPENAMMMIHDPLVGLMGHYNAEDFKEFISILEKIKDSIASGYIAKTGKSKEEIDEIMSNETWLLGSEAVEQGFADELISLDLNMGVENSGGNKFMIVNKLKFDVSNYKNMPKIYFENAQKDDNMAQNTKKSIKNSVNNTQKEEEIVNIEEFKNKYPDLYNQISNSGREEGVKAERERIKNIEEIAPKGFENLVENAKFKDAITAEALAMNIVRAQKDAGTKFLNEAEEDAEELDGVEPSKDEKTKKKESEEEKEAEVVNALVGAFKNRRKR